MNLLFSFLVRSFLGFGIWVMFQQMPMNWDHIEFGLCPHAAKLDISNLKARKSSNACKWSSYICIYTHTYRQIHAYVLGSCSVVCDSLWPRGLPACQAPLSMGISRQEYCRGLPFPSPGDLPYPGMHRYIYMCVLYVHYLCYIFYIFFFHLTSCRVCHIFAHGCSLTLLSFFFHTKHETAGKSKLYRF